MRFKEFYDNYCKTTIKDCSIFVKDGTHGTHKDVAIGIPLLSAKDILDNEIIINNNPRLISENDFYDIYKKFIPQVNDLLITIVGTVGRTAIIKKENLPFAFQRSVGWIRANEKIIAYYYLFLMKSSKIQKKLFEKVNASAQGGIYLDSLSSINIYIPSLAEQKKIANFLSYVDERIMTQKKIIEDLITFKKGILNSIFKGLDNYDKCSLDKVLKERKKYAIKDTNIIHATLSKDGIFPKTERYNRDFLVKDDDKNYKISILNDICYNPANLKFGVITRNKYGECIISPIYVTYEVQQGYSPEFVELCVCQNLFINKIRKYEQGTVYERMAVSSEDFLKGEIPSLPLDLQIKIVNNIKLLEEKIQNEKSILELYSKEKEYSLNKLFI